MKNGYKTRGFYTIALFVNNGSSNAKSDNRSYELLLQ